MKFASVFSGIGGLDYGCEMAGWQCVYQCEIDPFCRAVLRKHWPRVECHADIKTLTGKMILDAVGPVDCLIGGPPCQAASVAGKRKGKDDDRWLWGEWLRLVRELRPVFLVAENVPGFLSHRDSAAVFGDLKGAGFEVWPVVFGACDVGAPHRRKRVWIIGHSLANADGRRSGSSRRNAVHEGRRTGTAGRTCLSSRGSVAVSDVESASANGMADTDIIRASEPEHAIGTEPRRNSRTDISRSCARYFQWPARPGQPQQEWEPSRLIRLGNAVRDGGRTRKPRREADRRETASWASRCGALDWESEFELGGVPDGIEPALVQVIASHFSYSFRDACGWVKKNWQRIRSRQNKNALKAIGNAVVPQCAYVVAKAISEAIALDAHGKIS